MITRADCRRVIESHLDGFLSLDDLAAWAVDREHEGDFEPTHTALIAEVLSALRDAADPHRFRWEEANLDALLDRLDAEG